jgi:pimeloyl-ACP methyl ester carboxylesterase
MMTQPSAGPGMTGRFEQANGIDIYYEEVGSGEPLLLIHGGFGNHSMWAPLIPAFARHFRVIAPDSRGHGRTKNSIDRMTYGLMADDMAAFIRALGLDRPLVCGYSDGGQIVLEMGMRHPGLVKAYIGGGVIYQRAAEAFERRRAFGMTEPGVVDTEVFERIEPSMVKLLREYQDPYQGEGYWKTYLRQASFMWLEAMKFTVDDFGTISDPKLIVQGDRDTGNPVEAALYIYRALPRGELAIVPTSDHLFLLSNPDRFTNLALEFLLRHQAELKQE